VSSGEHAKRSRVTAADVARAAGVSTATVSLVMNGKDSRRVLPATRQRVLAEARKLGYRVDRRARSLVTGRSGILGFVAPDVANPFFGAVQMALLHELQDRYQLLSVATEVGHAIARANVEQLFALGVDGVIVASGASAVIDGQPPVPVVLLDAPGASPSFVRVNFDLVSASQALADHLLALGHRRFAYLEADSVSRTFVVRREAFERRVGVMQGTVVEARSLTDTVAAREAIRDRWREWDDEGVTAIVCASDVQAYGALGGLRSLGVRVPDRVSLAAFDDLPTAQLMEPPLTCVRLSADELGRLAAAELLEVMVGEARVREVVIAPSLQIRASTAKPRS
jgi:LacI family transcriptional regulator